MLTRAITAVVSGYYTCRVAKDGLMACFARAACPSDLTNEVIRCQREAEDFRRKIQEMTEAESHEVPFLAGMLEEGEEDQSLRPYSELMGYMAEIAEEFHDLVQDENGEPQDKTYAEVYPQTLYLIQTATNFMRAFNALPPVIQYLVNQGQSLGAALTPKRIYDTSEAMGFPAP